MTIPRIILQTEAWAGFLAQTHVPAAVRAGGWLFVTGHTGEDADETYPADVAVQIRNTFANIAETLTAAGLSWADVVEVTSYHVGLLAQQDQLTTISEEFLAHPFPAWSAVGVTELWDADALIEISCRALLPDAVGE